MGDQPKVSQAKAVVCRPQVGFEGMHGLRLNREAEPILFKIAHPEPVSLSLEALPPIRSAIGLPGQSWKGPAFLSSLVRVPK